MIHQTRQQLYALHAQHRIHQDAYHYTVQSAQRQRRARAAIIALADRRIGALTEELIAALGVNTTARSVLISAGQQRHILKHRDVGTSDADFALRRLQEAWEQPNYLVEKDEGSDTKFKVICRLSSVERYVLFALKFVPSAQSKKDDECWVGTAYYCGTSTFRRLKKQGKLRPFGSPAD